MSDNQAAGPLLGDKGRLPRRARAGTRARHSSLPLAWRIFGTVRSTILTLGAVLGVISILAFAGALILGLKPVVVISGSMEPTLPIGSVIFVRSVPVEDVTVGDIVTVERPRELGLVTHRVVDVINTDGTIALALKGDANDVEDPAPYAVTTAGLYAGHVPVLGYLTLFFQSRQGLIAGIGIVAAVIAMYLLDPARFASAPGVARSRRRSSR